MNLDNLLRDYARKDLKRFAPAAHYCLREHDPIADRELVKPLLLEPVRFGLTPRERVAATALDSLATYEIASRAIFDRANPARDAEDRTEHLGMKLDDERQIWGRRECFRASALVYARMLRDEQLIERYQTPEPPPVTNTAPATQAGQDAPTVPHVQADMSVASLLKELVITPVPTVQPVAQNPAFISLHELLLRLQKTHAATLTQAAHILLSWGKRTDVAPSWICDGKRGVVSADTFQIKCATDRLEFVFHRGQFESDGNGISTDYDLFGFNRREFAEFVTGRIGETMDLFLPMGDTEPAQASGQPQPQSGTVQPVHAAPVDTPWHLLATPTELIAVFGKFTGMDKTWFNTVKDKPKLKSAIHTVGKGGRNGREPLLFVFPVMQWLIDPKRRIGSNMTEATGWRLLKNQFRKVYEEFKDQEPDPDSPG